MRSSESCGSVGQCGETTNEILCVEAESRQTHIKWLEGFVEESGRSFSVSAVCTGKDG